MVLQDWKPSPLWQIKDQSWTASILFQGFGKHNYQFKDIILKVICEFSDCVFGHPLWKRNSVIYFLVEQSWTWINIWSIHYDQLSGGVLEAALQIPFNQITNTQQIWFILLGSFRLIYIIIGYISIEEFDQATYFGDCTRGITENIVAISWLVGDRREVSGCFPAYTSATPAATCHQHPRAQNCTPTLPLCSHSSGNLSCSQIWKSKPIPFLYS